MAHPARPDSREARGRGGGSGWRSPARRPRRPRHRGQSPVVTMSTTLRGIMSCRRAAAGVTRRAPARAARARRSVVAASRGRVRARGGHTCARGLAVIRRRAACPARSPMMHTVCTCGGPRSMVRGGEDQRNERPRDQWLKGSMAQRIKGPATLHAAPHSARHTVHAGRRGRAASGAASAASVAWYSGYRPRLSSPRRHPACAARAPQARSDARRPR